MFYLHGYPYSNFHDLNLDWILEKVSQNRDSILALENAINNLDPDSPVVGNPGVLHVGREAGMYSTINEAIAFAKSYCSPTKRVLIVIHGGEYNESIRLVPNPGIDMVGLSGTTIACPGATQYPDGALYTVGSGFFSGITFKTSGGGAYALHYEVQGYESASANTECVFENCSFIGINGKGGIGCGGGAGDKLAFINCHIESDTGTAAYIHNYPRAGGGTFNVTVDSCRITGNNSVMVEFYKANQMIMNFQNNVMSGHTKFREMSQADYTGWVIGDANLINNSSGNTGRAMETASEIISSIPVIDFANYKRAIIPVNGLVNRESFTVEAYNVFPFPKEVLYTVTPFCVEIAYNTASNPDVNNLTGTFKFRPQL